MDSPGIPLALLVIMLVVVPVCLAVLLGTRVFQRTPPLVFRCRRCNREFLRKPHRRFPAACPLCRARDWNR